MSFEFLRVSPIWRMCVMVACASCSSRSAPTTRLRAQTSDTLTAEAKNAALIAPSGDTALKYTYVIRDSAGLFDPGGYYSPEEPIQIDSFTLQNIELLAVWYYHGGQLHYDKPQVLTEPIATLSFALTGTERGGGIRCSHALATLDTLSLSCPGAPLGDLAIDGHFEAADSSTSLRSSDCRALRLLARVVVRRAGSVLHDGRHRFTCFEGD